MANYLHFLPSTTSKIYPDHADPAYRCSKTHLISSANITMRLILQMSACSRAYFAGLKPSPALSGMQLKAPTGPKIGPRTFPSFPASCLRTPFPLYASLLPCGGNALPILPRDPTFALPPDLSLRLTPLQGAAKLENTIQSRINGRQP